MKYRAANAANKFSISKAKNILIIRIIEPCKWGSSNEISYPSAEGRNIAFKQKLNVPGTLRMLPNPDYRYQLNVLTF